MSPPRPGDPWPLSAVATALLRGLDVPPDELLKLGLKELVVREVVRLEREERFSLLPARRVRLWLRPGIERVPPVAPLPDLAAAVRRVLGGRREELADVAKRLRRDDGRLAERLRDVCAADLRSRGLLRTERSRVLGLIPRDRLARTAEGEAWERASWEREDRLAALRDQAGSDAFVAEAAALGALALLLAPDLRRQVSHALDRRPDGGGTVAGGNVHDDAEALERVDLGALDETDTSFDSAVGGDGGGDGGGGDGG